MTLLTALALGLIATAQPAPQAAPAPAQTPPPAGAGQAAPANAEKPAFSTELPVETLMAHPAAREAVLEIFPGLDENPLYEALKVRSLRQIAPMSQGTITTEQLDKLDEALRAIHP